MERLIESEISKTYLTTVDEVDWSNQKISRVGIIPYVIQGDNVWLAFGISTLTNKLISIGGKVEVTDFNAFTALEREISEEIGDTPFSAEHIAGSQVLVENDRVLVFWDVENSENIKMSENSEIERLIWLTQKQLIRNEIHTIELSTLLHPAIEALKDIVFLPLSDYHSYNLPLNYDVESEKIFETQTLRNYNDFVKDINSSVWYIVYIYKIVKSSPFENLYFMKTERGHYYMFNDNTIHSVISTILSKRKIPIYFPAQENYSHLVNKFSHQVRYLNSLVRSELPKLLHNYNREMFSLHKYVNDDSLIRDGIEKVDLMSYYESLIYDSHKKTGHLRIKGTSYIILTSEINDLFFETGESQLDIRYIKEQLGPEAYNAINNGNVPFNFNYKTYMVSLP